ncbi:MAG: hypothetical protein SWN10_22905 [Pseudomonadota bacterium]|nr:hypothetical protein [Pseudomonadota bacterium]
MAAKDPLREALSSCKYTMLENPTDRQVEQARQDLGLPIKPRYKVPATGQQKFKYHWANEPVALAGREV